MSRRVSLKYRVLFWVSLAVALPMALLVGAAVRHGQQVYADEVDADMFAALDRTVAALDRRLFIEHDLIRALSQVPPVRALLPGLSALRDGSVDVDVEPLLEQVTRFFETFQGVRRSLGTVRVLDHDGDTLVKVRDGQRVVAIYEDFGEVPLIETGSAIPEFRAEIADLRPHDVGSIASPPGFDAFNAALNTVSPLLYDAQVVGYLLIAPPLEPIDRTLDVSARPRHANLLVAEINDDHADRHGMVLYADEPRTAFSAVGMRDMLHEIEPRLLDEGGSSMNHKYTDASGRAWYFRQYSPYPDRLVSWLFAYYIDEEHTNTPFWHANYVIWAIGLLSLFIGLLLAHFASRQVTRPVMQLADQLTRYADGARDVRLEPDGAPEMRDAQASFNRMADTLERLETEREQTQRVMLQNAKLTSIGQLAAGIAHELRNPLANIFSLTKLAQRRVPADDTQLGSDVANIRSEAERASNIIQGLLDFARQGSTHATEFELVDWLREAVALVARMAGEQRVEMRLGDIPRARVHGDRNLLQQALVNIVINALQVTPPQGRVDLDADCADNAIEIRVRDQGPGIPADIADRLFDPFFTTKAEGEGTGLGLSIAIGIVEQHGGSLQLENRPEGGAVARLRLPLPTRDPATG